MKTDTSVTGNNSPNISRLPSLKSQNTIFQRQGTITDRMNTTSPREVRKGCLIDHQNPWLGGKKVSTSSPYAPEGIQNPNSPFWTQLPKIGKQNSKCTKSPYETSMLGTVNDVISMALSPSNMPLALQRRETIKLVKPRHAR